MLPNHSPFKINRNSCYWIQWEYNYVPNSHTFLTMWVSLPLSFPFPSQIWRSLAVPRRSQPEQHFSPFSPEILCDTAWRRQSEHKESRLPILKPSCKLPAGRAQPITQQTSEALTPCAPCPPSHFSCDLVRAAPQAEPPLPSAAQFGFAGPAAGMLTKYI